MPDLCSTVSCVCAGDDLVCDWMDMPDLCSTVSCVCAGDDLVCDWMDMPDLCSTVSCVCAGAVGPPEAAVPAPPD